MSNTADHQSLPRLKVELMRTLSLGTGSRKQHIAAGSGLAKVMSWLHVVADDELFLGSFRLDRTEMSVKVRLFGGNLPADYEERKKAKPDLESVLHLSGSGGKPGHLLAVPSGSKKNRIKGALVPLKRTGRAKPPALAVSFRALYRKLKKTIPHLNIEGATIGGGTLSLLQRGNADGGINCLIDIDAHGLVDEILETGKLSPRRRMSIKTFELGTLQGVRLSFTGVSYLDGNRWVVMAAEKTRDTYHDGQCKGSVLAVITEDGNLSPIGILDFPHKVEGIFAENESGRIRLYFVTDADDRNISASLLSLVVDNVMARNC